MTTTANKICEVCGQPYEFALTVQYNQDGSKTCRHDAPSENKIEKRRKENRALSQEARQRAADFARNNPSEEMVTVKHNQNAKKSVQVPKKLVENLTDKIKPVIGA